MTSNPPSGPPSISLELNLAEHNIGMYIPPGAHMNGTLWLPTGVIIAGSFTGEILVECGAIVILGNGRFQGIAEASRIYVEGTVSGAGTDEATPATPRSAGRSVLIGRELIAASQTAQVNADLFASSFTSTRAKVWGSMRSLAEVTRRPFAEQRSRERIA